MILYFQLMITDLEDDQINGPKNLDLTVCIFFPLLYTPT